MKKILVCLSIVLVAGTVLADTKPIQLSLTPDIAISSFFIRGCNIWRGSGTFYSTTIWFV